MPATATTYLQACPVCCRQLQVPVRLLGKRAACHHCEATFVARDASNARLPVRDPRDKLLERANALLSACDGHQQAGLVDSTMQES